MAFSYRTPGVYVEEIPGGAHVIEGVGTSTAGLVGSAPKADAHLHQPILTLNWLHFRREFVDDAQGRPQGPSTDLVRAVFGFFQNGGSLCYVVNVGNVDGPVPGGTGSREGIDALDLVDEVAIVAAPGFYDPVSHDRLLTHCEIRKDRVAVCDGPPEFTDIVALTKVGTESARTPPSRRSAGSAEAGGGAGEDAAPPPVAPSPTVEEAYRPRMSNFGAFYVPWLEVADPLDGSQIVPCAPSGHIAGVWARTDGERGVHKAPANTVIRGASKLTVNITASEQELLNPEGVNCLRYFPGQGNLVWGARTLGDAEWKYVNVRRLFCMVEESILRSTRWIVFEPNDPKLWKSIIRDCTAFLTRLWRDGALFGRTPEEAFFVQCDSETNPKETRDAGQVIIMIGLAPVKPAEFVIFKVSQHEAGSEIVSEGGA
ncbi:MAG: phage tail sheath family protein [Geodermatophilaceae bacterium]